MSKRKKKKGRISTIFLVLMMLVGLSVMAYPTVSDWWNQKTASKLINHYNQTVLKMDEESVDRMFNEAKEYNSKLIKLNAPFSEYDKIPGYDEILDISGLGIMGVITIPVVQVELPIYHGTSSEVLNTAAGHLQGSTLPVGGANTHCVISAHRGLPSARLFTDLDKMEVGDTFTITVLDRVFTYQLEQILIVLPEEMDKLAIIPDGDYVTLMTCTPYGVNTHRLLLRSKRIETVYAKDVKIFADAAKVDSLLVVPFIAGPLFILLMIFWMFTGKRKSISPRETAFSLVSTEQKG